jgi:hypothetical protein
VSFVKEREDKGKQSVCLFIQGFSTVCLDLDMNVRAPCSKRECVVYWYLIQ